MNVCTVLFSSLVAGAAGGSVPVLTGPVPALALQSSYGHSYRDVVFRAFQDVLGRDPHSDELRRYTRLMEDEGWTERDIRRDLRERSSYRRDDDTDRRRRDNDDSDRRSGRETTRRDDDDSGRRSGRETTRRDDDDSGRGSGRETTRRDDDDSGRGSGRETTRRDNEDSGQRRGGDQGSDRQQRSSGQATLTQEQANKIVRDAYRATLGRDADAGGLRDYSQRVLRDNWNQGQIEKALRDSPEYANRIVRDAYRAILGRDADAGGLRDYSQRVLRDHWSQRQVEDALRNSPEYRSKHR
jgi:hypothetical protein